MSDFDQSQWANPDFSREFLDNADHYLPDRFHLFHVLRSFYRFFIARPGETRLCELGCGDGILTEHWAIDARAGANDPFWLNLSLQVGGDWPKDPDSTTPFPSQMDVDYVRVYQE